MATVKEVLDKHFFSFLDENGLESLREKMIETITKCEYELDDVIESIVDIEIHSACTEVEHHNSYLNEMIDALEDDYKKLESETKELKEKFKFFEPETLQDEFKIQWIKDNWNKIPTI
jgi:predicted nuclease with TOPRIM domain